jgi:hypothetical protein
MGTKHTIVVDNRVHEELLKARSFDMELWPVLVEKAFIKLFV